MPPAAIAFLAERLRTTRCFLEYGAGGSTVLAARSGVEVIYSVESDPGYVAAVEARVEELGTAAELRAVYADIGPTGRFGHPTDRTGIERWDDYSAAVWRRIAHEGRSPETILVDGRFRVACCLQSFLHMAGDAVLVFDDYFDREDRYDVVTRFAPVRRRVDRMAVFGKPDPCDAAAIGRVYAEYARAPA